VTYFPQRRRAAQLQAVLDQLYIDLEAAKQDDAPGAALMAHDIRQAIHETQHALFMCGVSDED